MTNQQNLIIVTIETTSPEEHRTRLASAINNAMKWYASTPDKTAADITHVHTLAELSDSILRQ